MCFSKKEASTLHASGNKGATISGCEGFVSDWKVCTLLHKKAHSMAGCGDRKSVQAAAKDALICTLLWQKGVTGGLPSIWEKCVVTRQSPWSGSLFQPTLARHWQRSNALRKAIGVTHPQNSGHILNGWGVGAGVGGQRRSSLDFSTDERQWECSPRRAFTPLLLCCGLVNFLRHFLILALETCVSRVGGHLTSQTSNHSNK